MKLPLWCERRSLSRDRLRCIHVQSDTRLGSLLFMLSLGKVLQLLLGWIHRDHSPLSGSKIGVLTPVFSGDTCKRLSCYSIGSMLLDKIANATSGSAMSLE